MSKIGNLTDAEKKEFHDEEDRAERRAESYNEAVRIFEADNKAFLMEKFIEDHGDDWYYFIREEFENSR